MQDSSSGCRGQALAISASPDLCMSTPVPCLHGKVLIHVLAFLHLVPQGICQTDTGKAVPVCVTWHASRFTIGWSTSSLQLRPEQVERKLTTDGKDFVM